MDIYDFSVDYKAITVENILHIHKYLMEKKQFCIKCLGLLKKLFFTAKIFLVSNANSLECVSMKNQECKVREEIISVNNNESVFYASSVRVNKCSGNCNKINDPIAKSCVPDVLKNINLKVLN